MNSAALKAAGITSATKDPVGGKIERDANGNPTGLLVDAAMELVTAKVPPPTPKRSWRRRSPRHRTAPARDGITAVGDMGTSAADWAAMHSAAKAGRLNVRIMGYAAGLEPIATMFPNGPTPTGCSATGCGWAG